MSHWKTGLAFVITSLALATCARAEISVSIGSANIAAGSMTGTIDITVSSTSMDELTDFGLELQITQISAMGTLQFTSTQPVPFGNPDYIFAGVSLYENFTPTQFWSVSPLEPSLTANGGDFYYSTDPNAPGYVTIPSTPTGLNSYLGSLQFDATGAAVGDTYQISLVPMSGNNTDTTYFDDYSVPLNFSSTPGTVTIVAAAVPEPSSMLLAIAGSLCGAMWHCGIRKGRTN